jgi:hypothetical protein
MPTSPLHGRRVWPFATSCAATELPSGPDRTGLPIWWTAAFRDLRSRSCATTARLLRGHRRCHRQPAHADQSRRNARGSRDGTAAPQSPLLTARNSPGRNLMIVKPNLRRSRGSTWRRSFDGHLLSNIRRSRRRRAGQCRIDGKYYPESDTGLCTLQRRSDFRLSPRKKSNDTSAPIHYPPRLWQKPLSPGYHR